MILIIHDYVMGISVWLISFNFQLNIVKHVDRKLHPLYYYVATDTQKYYYFHFWKVVVVNYSFRVKGRHFYI